MQVLNTVQSWILRVLVFLLPLFFLPITVDFIDFNKLVLLIAGVLAALLVWSVSLMRSEFKLRFTPFDLPVAAFALINLASAIINTPNKFDAFIAPGTATQVLVGTLLYFVLTQYFRRAEDEGNSFWNALLSGGAAAAVVAAFGGLGGFGMLAKYVALPAWLVPTGFNTLGGIVPALTFFVTLLPIALGRLSKKKDMGLNTLFLLLLAVGILTMAYFAAPGKDTSPRFLPLGTGWSIALETLKGTPILGVGPGNFVEAFNRFRPVEFNSSEVWTSRFIASSNWYLTVWTITGLAGLIAFLLLVWKVAKEIGRNRLEFAHWGLMVVLGLLLFAPENFMLLVLLYIYLAAVAWSRGEDYTFHFGTGTTGSTTHGQTNLLPGILALLVLILGIFVVYRGEPIYAADMAYRRALDGYVKKDSKIVGNEIVRAIQINSNVDNYRTFYVQVSLESVGVRAQNKDITDDDRQAIATLIQQAIREARAAVALNISHAQNWENLARTYQAIMPFAKDADQFAIDSYQQAIFLDPVNPILRVSLGGVFYAVKNYEEAVKAFELAVAAKPDYANAHYNLAITLRDKGNTARAAQEMAATLKLIQAGSKDAELVQKELDSLNKKLSEEASASAKAQGVGGTNQPPLQAPAQQQQKINPPLNLPAEAAPPSPAPQEPNPPQPQQ